MQTDSFYHKTYEDARAARARFRAQHPNFVVRVEPSPYGEGYRIRMFPARFVLNGLIDYRSGRPSAGFFGGLRRESGGWV